MEDYREAAATPAEEDEVEEETVDDDDDRDGGVPMDTGTDTAGTSALVIDIDDDDTEPAPATSPVRPARRRVRRHRDPEAHRRIDDLTDQMIDSYAALSLDIREMQERQHYYHMMTQIQFQHIMGYPFDPSQYPYVPPPPPPDRDY